MHIKKYFWKYLLDFFPYNGHKIKLHQKDNLYFFATIEYNARYNNDLYKEEFIRVHYQYGGHIFSTSRILF